jgi:helicase MOV-10
VKRENFVNFEWFNKQIGKNEEQMAAIKNIVNCTAFPFPYVVFGPPGTGKTSCIVECIAQVLKLKPNSRIIVTAQSNSACDEIGVRLLKHVSWNKVFRYYSPSMQINSEGYNIPDILRRTSNLRSKTSQFPSKEEFSHFKVMITTLMSCSRLVQVDYKINRHFDYIFVDECASALELESLIPIVGKFMKIYVHLGK